MSTTLEPIHQRDSLGVFVPIIDGEEALAPISLTGATLEARMTLCATIVDGASAIVTGVAGGIVTIFFGAGIVDAKGNWTLQACV
ncbi:MAG: hypothetical protein AAGB05_08040 [Pseudomonadota bacterium]